MRSSLAATQIALGHARFLFLGAARHQRPDRSLPSPHTGIRLEWHALARRLFERHGIAAEIVDAADLPWNGRELRADELTIDMVYNRLVDFSLDEASHAALRAAYLAGAIVVTPNPRNHALFADKRNLTLLTDSDLLRRWGVPAERIATLAVLPRAVAVTQTNANALWAERKRLFFKPVAGHGGKAVYRGDKLTRAAWSEIRATDHIAQDLAAPSERHVMIGGAPQRRKMDIRLYTYEGELLLAAARLYQEQTTNFAYAFDDAWRMLQNRITTFCNLPSEGLDRLTLQRKVDEI